MTAHFEINKLKFSDNINFRIGKFYKQVVVPC